LHSFTYLIYTFWRRTRLSIYCFPNIPSRISNYCIIVCVCTRVVVYSIMLYAAVHAVYTDEIRNIPMKIIRLEYNSVYPPNVLERGFLFIVDKRASRLLPIIYVYINIKKLMKGVCPIVTIKIIRSDKWREYYGRKKNNDIYLHTPNCKSLTQFCRSRINYIIIYARMYALIKNTIYLIIPHKKLLQ